MRIYPFRLGRRIILYHEFVWLGWHHWMFGVDLGYEPRVTFGPLMLRWGED